MSRVVNEKAYKPTSFDKVVELKVRVMLDAVPGCWHQPIDIMNWIASHSYVQDVELVEPQAAAPDMLEALNLIDAYLYATAPGSNERQIVQRAIRKATQP